MYIYITPKHFLLFRKIQKQQKAKKRKKEKLANFKLLFLKPFFFITIPKQTHYSSSSSSSSSSITMASSKPPFKTLFLITILAVSLLSGHCSASARLGKITAAIKAQTTETKPASSEEKNKLQPQTGFQFRGQTFNFFPKGNPVPPSGPSKRHNSSPQN